MDELDEEKRPSPIVFPDESQPYKDPEMIEMCDFFEFSVKPNTSFRGTVEMITYLSEDKSDEPINYFIKVADGEATWSYKYDKEPDVKLSITKDKLLYIYSGKASSGEITNMIWSGEVHVHDWNYRKLLQFANSFDYSSQKWDEFYKSREKSNSLSENPSENSNSNINPALELLSPHNQIVTTPSKTIITPTTTTTTTTSSSQIINSNIMNNITPRSRRSFSPSKSQLKTLLKTPRVRQYVEMISSDKNRNIRFGKMPGLMINNKNLCCFGTWSLYYHSVPNLLNVEKMIKRIEPKLRYSYYYNDDDDDFQVNHLSYPIELIRTPVPRSRHKKEEEEKQQKQQLICDNETNNQTTNNVNRKLFLSPSSSDPLPSIKHNNNNHHYNQYNTHQQQQQYIQQQQPPPPPPQQQSLSSSSLSSHTSLPTSNNIGINNINNRDSNDDAIGKMLNDIEFGGLTNFVTYVSKDEHESFLSKETKKKLLDIRKTAQSFLEKVPFDNIPSSSSSSHYYYQDYNPVLVDQNNNQNQGKQMNVTHKSPLLSSMPSNFVEDKNKKKKSKKRKDSFGTLANFFSL